MPGETETISVDNRNDTGRSLENTYYSYLVADEVKQTTSDGKNMSDIISKGTESSAVPKWIASSYVTCKTGYAVFGVRMVDARMRNLTFYNNSSGGSRGANLLVRPVVTLKSDIQLSGNSNDGWTIN